MFGMYSKPLHQQPARHRHRRGGIATEQLRGALSAPSGGRRPAMGRPATERERSYQRLIARRSNLTISWRRRLGALLCALALAFVVTRWAATASDLVPFDEDPQSYTRLVEAVEASCIGSRCAFGWSNPADPPDEIMALMSRVRARDVIRDSMTGRTRLLGAYDAAFSLTHDGARTASQQHNLRVATRRDSLERARYESRGLTLSTQRVRDLGGGWTLWRGRLRPAYPR